MSDDLSKDKRQFRCKLCSLLLLSVFNIILGLLFVIEWSRYGTYQTGANNTLTLPNTNLFISFLIFFIGSIIQLIPVFANRPVPAVLISLVKFFIFIVWSYIIAGYSPALQPVTGSFVEYIVANEIAIVSWLSVYLGIAAFVADMIVYIIWIRHRNRMLGKSVKAVELIWKISGCITVLMGVLIFIASMYTSFYTSTAVDVLILGLILAIVWWYVSKHSRLWSTVLFVILSIGTVYMFYAGVMYGMDRPRYAIVPIIMLVVEVIWYASTIILFVKRRRELAR